MFYDVDGHNYPSVTTILGYNTGDGIKKWRESVGEDVANYEMRRASSCVWHTQFNRTIHQIRNTGEISSII